MFRPPFFLLTHPQFLSKIKNRSAGISTNNFLEVNVSTPASRQAQTTSQKKVVTTSSFIIEEKIFHRSNTIRNRSAGISTNNFWRRTFRHQPPGKRKPATPFPPVGHHHSHHLSLRCFWRNVSSKCLEFGGSHVTATRHVRVSRLSSITDNTIRSQWLPPLASKYRAMMKSRTAPVTNPHIRNTLSSLSQHCNHYHDHNE